MESLAPHILTAKVMHKRLFPKINSFHYGVYYLALPLSKLDNLDLPFVFSFHRKDHGAKDGNDLRVWIGSLIPEVEPEDEILLITLPRVLGYVFNPISFWLCLNANGQVRAMLCEVNNTFGESHSYICRPENGQIILPEDMMTGEKIFHVSPFLEREGSYQFRIDYQQAENFGAWIDYYDKNGKKQLVTSLMGNLQPLTKQNMWRCFWRYPLVTFKVIGLIHYQALRLFIKGIRYIPKPVQKPEKLSFIHKETRD
jgi:DUF1365 family protein